MLNMQHEIARAIVADIPNGDGEQLTADERRELDQWHADRNYVESGDDHAFDYWLNGELARIERRIAALEMQLEAQNTF